MPDVTELREKQQNEVANARDCLEQIDATTDEARAQEIEAQHDKHMAEYDRLEELIQRQERIDEAEGRLNKPDPRRPVNEDRSVPGAAAGRDLDDNEVFQRAMRFGVESLDTEERHRVAELRASVSPEMRAQAAGTDAAGGYTVPEGFQVEIIKSMQMYGPMLDPGITRQLPTDSGNPLPWPTMDDTANKGALLGENTQAGEQDVTFGQKQLDAYTYTSKIVRVSLQLLQDSAFDMNRLIRDVFGERIGRIGNEHLTVGTGSSQPNGIVTASANGNTTSGTSAVTWEEVMDLYHSVDPAYRNMPNTRFMFHDNTLKALRKIKDNDGRFIWQPADVRTGAPATILEEPYSINQDMPQLGTGNKFMVYGDFARYVVRLVRDFTMLRLTERYADYLQVGFIGFSRLDGELVDGSAVKHMANA